MTRIALLVIALTTSIAHAEDWPQWRGPNRDNLSKEKGLLQQWPEGGPKLLWTYKDAGNSYSSFAVVGDRVYTMGANDSESFVFALDVKTGKKVWQTSIAKRFDNAWGGGPRSTPTIDGEYLYALDGQGELVCLKTADGTKVWSKNLSDDLRGQMMTNWGHSESVLIDGDLLICTPGGRDGTLAALDKKTGKEAWRSSSLTDAAAYSSIRNITVGGVRQYVQQTRNGLVGVSAKDGKLLWKHENDRYRTAVVPTPIISGENVYVSVGYGVGCTLLKLSANGSGGTKAEVVYDNRTLVNKHGGVLLYEGDVYGHDDGGAWVCQDFRTGKEKWRVKGQLGRRSRSGSLTCADGCLYLLSDRGDVGLIEASPKGWNLKGQFKLPASSRIRSRRGGVWSHPVVANGRLYLRDQDLIFCYDVKAK